MSEILGEARVIIRPDTTRFRAELQTAVLSAARSIPPVPISVVPTLGATGAAAAAAQLAAQTTAATSAATKQAVALEAAGAAAQRTTRSVHAATDAQAQFQKGLVASTAGLTGLRGAVLSASSPFLVAAVGATAFFKAISTAADLESNLNVFRVTAGATADEMDRVGAEAKALGRDLELPGVTAGDAAETFLTLSRAGLSVQESLAGARGTLQLATAAEISFADAAQLTASALNAFQLQGEQAVNVADLLTNAANASQASISDMGIALRQSAAIADRVGFSLSETVTFLTQLARSGLAGSDAGTSFRVAMQRLIAPTDKARKAIEGLHLNLRDANENLRPEVFFELTDALNRMGKAQADVTLQTIFGNDASRAAAFFARVNTEAFRAQEKTLLRAGAAAEIAGARNEGFAGSVENLKNQISALGIEIGELALPGLGVAADTAATFFGLLATEIAGSRDAIGGFAEDAEKLQIFFQETSRDAGFTDFLRDVGEGAQLLAGDLQNASDATDEFFSGIAGGRQAADTAAGGVDRLTAAEKEHLRAMHDARPEIVGEARDLKTLSDAAANAALAVARLAGQQRGLEEQTARARIAGDEGAELASLRERRANLEAELAAQEEIIARPGRGGEATARAAIRQRILPQLEAVSGEIENIFREQQSRQEAAQRERESAQDDLVRARNEADREFLAGLAGGREDAGRRVSAAAETEGIQDDIRRQDQLQALIKSQIEKIRDRIADEKTRKAAIRELRIALIDSRREEEALRDEQRDAVQAQVAEGLDLDIAFAETTENTNREIAARQRMIALLKKQQAAVKKGTNEWKRLRNEIAEQQAAIKDARDQADEDEKSGKSAQQFFFEQLQAQQGFAANLMGNLIRGPTAGLVGVPAPGATGLAAPNIGAQISGAAAKAAGEARIGPTAGQGNTEIRLLERILDELKSLNRHSDAPEAKEQRRAGSAAMDGQGGAGGGVSAVM